VFLSAIANRLQFEKLYSNDIKVICNKHQFEKEEQLLMLCSRIDIQESELKTLRELSRDALDWTHLVEVASYHRVFPLLYYNIKKYIPNYIPDDICDRLKDLVKRNGAKNLFMLSRLLSILAQFKEHGLQVLAFKGPVLAEDVYGNVGLRTFSDLDLLISHRDLEKAVSLLRAQGFCQDIDLDPAQYRKLVDKWHHAVLKKDGIMVELHWELTGRYFSRNVEIESLLPRVEEIEVAGHKIQMLGPEDLLLFLCVHGCHHYWVQLDSVCCIAELVKKKTNLDWELVWQLARQLGALKMVVLGLLLAREMLGLVLPGRVEERLAEYPRVKNIAENIAGKMLSISESAPLQMIYWENVVFHYDIMDRRIDWLRCYLRSLSNPTHSDWLWIRLPASLSVLYYILRPLRLVGKYSRKLFR
jgi:hypothetical protein